MTWHFGEKPVIDKIYTISIHFLKFCSRTLVLLKNCFSSVLGSVHPSDVFNFWKIGCYFPHSLLLLHGLFDVHPLCYRDERPFSFCSYCNHLEKRVYVFHFLILMPSVSLINLLTKAHVYDVNA